MASDFIYADERFADLQLLRYKVSGFEQLSVRQKTLLYYLSQATLAGRDITTDQFGKYNLLIRKTLEAVLSQGDDGGDKAQWQGLELYLKRLWFSNGIYHHYGCEKFQPAFTSEYLKAAILRTDENLLPVSKGQTVEDLWRELEPIIFNPDLLPKRVNKRDGDDLVKTSACNYYENVSQQEAEDYYAALKKKYGGDRQPSFGLNTKLVKRDGKLQELVYKVSGLYGKAIQRIVHYLQLALPYTENEQQHKVLELLIEYYNTGDLKTFDQCCIDWVKEVEGQIYFVNGFIEVYGDPLGLKGSWEGIVGFTDLEATHRTQTICRNAQWFEDNSPVDARFKKPKVVGVTANVINAAMLGGDEYPSTAIGINLPNADWIRAQYGSKSVTIGNLTDAYNKAAHGNGFKEEFVIDQETLNLIDKYGDQCDDLHTDLHECLGHGSGRLLDGTDPDALKSYGNTIEEARADLFGLYYIADKKLVELGLLPNHEAYKAQYYTYMMNGLLTQLTRIQPNNKIEEAHMRNRALIARWAIDLGGADVAGLITRQGKTYVYVKDYEALRKVFAKELAEIQRIKSEGDYTAARMLVEKYAVDIDPALHKEILDRYKRLNLAPYKGFINPRMMPVRDESGNIVDVKLSYTETYSQQMLRYSREYNLL